MDETFYGDDYKYIPMTSVNSGESIEVLPDIFVHTIQLVNICLVGNPKDENFVLIDTGMPHCADEITKVVEQRFGENGKPQAIILTHGHFDHIGAVIELVQLWDVPVYAHEKELPYLTGKVDYPAPDPTVDGGLVSKMSGIFPHEKMNLAGTILPLPLDGSVPFLPEFKWLHTPGHSVGHVSLFREKDHLLIAGDTFITVKQDYLAKVFMQELEVSGPPRYLTTDWHASYQSVKKLWALKPHIAVTSHGAPVKGEQLRQGLTFLVENFQEMAVPKFGKYI